MENNMKIIYNTPEQAFEAWFEKVFRQQLGEPIKEGLGEAFLSGFRNPVTFKLSFDKEGEITAQPVNIIDKEGSGNVCRVK